MTIEISSLLFEKSSFPNFRLEIKIPNNSPKKAPEEIPITKPKLPKTNEKEIPKMMLALKEKNSIKKERPE